MDYLNKISEKPQFLCLGEVRVNVLALNIVLDKINGK